MTKRTRKTALALSHTRFRRENEPKPNPPQRQIEPNEPTCQPGIVARLPSQRLANKGDGQFARRIAIAGGDRAEGELDLAGGFVDVDSRETFPEDGEFLLAKSLAPQSFLKLSTEARAPPALCSGDHPRRSLLIDR